MTEPEKLIHLLRRTSAPLGAKAVARIIAELERLVVIDAELESIRDVTGLYSSPVTELAGLIEDIVSNLATQNAALSGPGSGGE